jgi:hypothetical protein
MTQQLLHRQAQSAARLLAGAHPDSPITRAEFEAWHEEQLLLAVGDVVERRHGHFNELLPLEMRERYVASRYAAVAVDAGERQVIGQVLRALAQAGVPALLLKGAALAYTVYPAPWIRARSDIDLLVPPGTMTCVAGALTQLDFEPAREVTHPLITRQRHFIRGQGLRAAVDVHETLVNPPVLRTLPAFDILYARSQPVSGLPVAAKGLSAADALMHALVHRVAHHNSSVDLLWLYDMHLLAQQMELSDWEQFVDTCMQSRVSRIAADGLQLLVDVLRSPVPSGVIERLQAVEGEASAALLGGTLTELRLQWVNFKSLHGVGERVEFIRAHVAPPSSDVSFGSRARWNLPWRYAVRAVFGARKWLRPIARSRGELRKKN